MNLTAESCDCCFESNDTVPVLIDDNMETFMCRPCIKACKGVMDIEILDNE